MSSGLERLHQLLGDLNPGVTVIAADPDLLAADGHHPLDAVLVTTPHGKTSVAIATEITIAIAEGTVTALEVPSTGRLPKRLPNPFVYLRILTSLRLQ